MINPRRYLPLLAAGMMLAGCGLFETRTPQNPVNAGSSFEPPTTPSVVLRNLESALNSANANDYRKCFSDTARGLPPFLFIPSAQGVAAAPTTFSTWGIAQEEQYILNVFSELQKGGVCSVTFNPSDVTEVPISDSVQYSAHYAVSFPHSRENAERSAQGLLQFTMRQTKQNEWYISTWRDIAQDTSTSWSLIKARFISR
ncbi:MAG: hypothetical protein ABIR47_18215 [Candidatus Kapaibacterium sp.]